MSGPYQVPSFNASNPNSSLSPQPRGNTPLSFRTNVNRAKTRRWVEAKKYSYDGDEWGDDEYGEYDQDDNKSALQDQHAGVNRSTPDISSTLPGGMPRPPLPSMDRAHSMDRVQTLSADTSAAPSSSPASIVRPADIYRRMREDPNSSASVNSPLIDHGSGASTPVQATNFGVDGNSESNNNPAPATSTANELPAISLPEVKRLSVFSPDLFSEPETTQTRGPTGQPHQLQHNPSLGFRSAVNQAFDVETPSTATDSVARSDSGSTAAISPIIAHRSTTTGQNTPTIEEEPGENIETPTENNIGFRPGHRRDLSLPSSGNSPSRKPMVTEPNTSASPESAHLSARTPSESAVDAPLSSQQQSSEPSDSYSPSQGLSERDRPAPLSVQTSVPPGPSATTENVPVIVPSMSTETSPEDTENDRLRKEIIRSLSRENTPSDQDTPPQTSRQDNLLPTGYESYRDEQPPAAPAEQGPSAPTFNAAHAAEAPSSEPAAPIPQQGAKPKLQRRFSWEESSDDEEPTPATQEQAPRPPAMPGQYPFPQERIQPDAMVAPASQLSEGVNPVRGMDGPGLAPTPAPASEKPRLTVVPPSAVDAGSAPSNSQVPESAQPQTMETLARAEDGQSPDLGRPPMGHPPQTPPASNESGLLGFKDILGIQSPEERIDAFNRTRGQFAVIDTGLSHWVRVTIHAHPEHSDVVQRNSQPLSEEFKNSVPRTKFPKLSSLGNLASSLQDGSHSGSGHIRRPSGHLGSMKQHQVGKDFLHTAGVLGGQAGKAAKGFFSKSRSKLKGSGEKVEP
ncbi:hypothetical protein BJX61DRAFT_512421 [Aspergillus egyptiacus]|nr:hypothetical protein BJX61DRAFT_512421 [Aspergillus egyptiacus]